MALLNSVEIYWYYQTQNQIQDGFYIYKSNSRIDRNNLPTPYATVDPSESMYVDSNVSAETTYYYMVAAYKGTDVVAYPGNLKITTAASPGVIGSSVEGGIIIGHLVLDSSYGSDEGTYAIIMTSDDVYQGDENGDPTTNPEVLSWADNSTPVTAPLVTKNGLQNTYYILEDYMADVREFPAARYCVIQEENSKTDWYLPSMAELALVWANQGYLGDLTTSDNTIYLSSEENPNDKTKVMGSTLSGTQTTYDNLDKTAEYAVRPVRRIKIA